MRRVLRDQEPFLYSCSRLRIDFVGDCDGVEDFVGDFECEFRGLEGEDDVLLCLMLGSSSVFFSFSFSFSFSLLLNRPIRNRVIRVKCFNGAG